MKNDAESLVVQPAWHAEKIENVFSTVKSNKEGLAHEDAAGRLEKYGHNKLTPLKKKSPVARFFLQFHNVLIYVLLSTGVVTFLLKHYLDAGVILGVIGAQLIFTYTSPMQQLFGTSTFPAETWLKIILISMSVFVLVEVEKRITQRWELKRKKIPARPTVQCMS